MKKWILLAILLLMVACSEEESVPATPPPATASESLLSNEADPCLEADTFDGIYSFSFSSEQLVLAVGTFAVEDGAFTGDLTNALRERFEITGCVSPDGVLLFDTLSNNAGETVSAKGTFENGAFSGSYQVGDREGTFAGSLVVPFIDALPVAETATPSRMNLADCAPQINRITEHDGIYNLTFVVDEQRLAIGTFSIEAGVFAGNLTNAVREQFTIAGCVDESGILYFSQLASDSGSSIIAQGEVGEGILRGEYQVNGRSGIFRGSRLVTFTNP